jgi:sorting nexin-3/12
MVDTTADATRRLNVKKQTLDDAYAAPANFLEIDVINPTTHGVAKKRYTDYEVRMKVIYLVNPIRVFAIIAQ